MKWFLLLCLVLIATLARAQSIRVIDDAGASVAQCEIMWHTADSGYALWHSSLRHLPRDADVIDIVVRADGYATTVQRFQGDLLADLHAGKATVTLHRGQEVKLQLNVADGSDIPDDFLPQMYFPQFAWRVRMMWQPVNLRNARSKPDFNMLNVSRITDRVYSFRLPKEPTQFLVAFQHPGWLQFHEVGPLSSRDVRNGLLNIDVPEAAAFEVSLDTGGAPPTQLPFEDALVEVHWPNPDMDGSVYAATWDERIKPGETRTFSDFGPGQFTVTIRTQARQDIKNIAGTEINPGQFFARREIKLFAGATEELQFRWTPFDPTAYRGDGRARLKLLTADGSPAAGVPVKVQWFDGHYGVLVVHEGNTASNGSVLLEGISTEVVTESPYGPYSVELDGESIGWFRLQPTSDIQDFEFRAAPTIGDQAPDIDLVAIETGDVRKLSELRGQVVLLEFWATWCGPCQPAMDKLNELAAENPAWADKTVIIPLCVDKTSQLAVDHALQRGWTALRHCWSPRGDNGQSQAEQTFVVRGIPTAILLKADGTIAWRGHPLAEHAGGVSLRERIEAVLREK